MLRYAFFWQIGNRVRDYLPSYVNIVELSTVGMKGYVQSLRAHLDTHVMAVRAFHLSPSELDTR